MEQSPSREDSSCSASQEITHLFGNQRFITLSIKGHHWFLFWAKWLQSIPAHPIHLGSILILSSHVYLEDIDHWQQVPVCYITLDTCTVQNKPQVSLGVSTSKSLPCVLVESGSCQELAQEAFHCEEKNVTV